MRGTFSLGAVAGVPVRAHWSVLGLAALIVVLLGDAVLPRAVPGLARGQYWSTAVVGGCVFMLSLLIHEMAHALVARWCGLKVGSITVWGLGGYTEVEEKAKNPRVELVVAAAGPLASVALGGLGFLVLMIIPGKSLTASAVTWLSSMNLLIGAFNLLPGAPLDGGRVLHGLLWWRFKDRSRADRASARAGHFVGTTLVAAGLFGTVFAGWLGGLWLVLVGWFIVAAARQELTVTIASAGLRGMLVREVMTADPDRAPAWMTVGEFIGKTALTSRQSIFPVVDLTGAPIGSVTLAALMAVPRQSRGVTRIDALPTRRPVRAVEAGGEATELLQPAGGQLIAVVEAGVLVGMVTAADLDRIVGQAILRAGPDTAD
ncbi:M50 family metallopeptidase [Nonomuraea spiralis]|uniref:Zinc metalloprotease n=1 Tax=Nonomuraea spiralis TaxID=46182 RepID=A0ABV5IY34_9ACTN|nr:site-2 protease family protein [Nonomuraea spiralis]GGS89350.1 zinc metalloprotease [Nonomuraea spiralis]